MSNHEDVNAPSVDPSRFRLIETEGDIFHNAPDGAVLIHAVNCQGQWGSGIAKAFKTKYPAAFQVYKSHCNETSRSRKHLVGTCLLIPPQADDYGTRSPTPTGVPEDNDGESEASRTRKRRKVTAEVKKTKKHWIACLFTSYGYGKRTKTRPGKDPPAKILGNTEAALRGLRAQLQVLDAELESRTERIGKDTGRRGKAAGGEDAEGTTSRIGGDGDKATEKGHRETREAGRVADVPGPLYACKFNSGSFGVEWRDTRALVEEVFEGSMVSVMHVVSPPSAMGR